MMRYYAAALFCASLWAYACSPALAQTVFMVQLGSFPSEREAQQHWQTLSSAYPELFETLSYSPGEALGQPDEFITYRTQGGPIATRNRAEAICDVLAENDETCYVVETAMFLSDDASITTGASLSDEAIAEEGDSAIADNISDDEAPAPIIQAAQQAPVTQPITQPVTSAVQTANAESEADQAVLDAAPVPAITASNVVPQQATPAAAIRAVSGAQAATPDTAYAITPNEAAQFSSGNAVPQAVSPSGNLTVSDAPPIKAADAGQVAVAEAIAVPLSGTKSAIRNPYLERGNTLMDVHPSASVQRHSYWADISYFGSERAAVGYVQTLKSRDSLLPTKLRVRITRPYGNIRGAQKFSLRLGPFLTTRPVRRLCALTRVDKLRCRAIKDMGGSVRHTAGAGSSLRPAASRSYTARRRTVNASAIRNRAAVTNREQYGSYYVQLGSFMSAQAADDKWAELSTRHTTILSDVQQDVLTPERSSGRNRLFRLRTGPFESSYSANALCDELKRAGTLCVVVKR